MLSGVSIAQGLVPEQVGRQSCGVVTTSPMLYEKSLLTSVAGAGFHTMGHWAEVRAAGRGRMAARWKMLGNFVGCWL